MKEKTLPLLMLSAITLSVSAYVRPVAYYMASYVMLLIIYFNRREQFRRIASHVVVFAMIVIVLLGAWHYRNMQRFGKNQFSQASNMTVGMKGLIGSFDRNEDMYTQDAGLVEYYLSVTARSFMSLMTRPVFI